MASVQSAAPTKQDVEVLLDKPQQTIKNYGIGGVIGAGQGAEHLVATRGIGAGRRRAWRSRGVEWRVWAIARHFSRSRFAAGEPCVACRPGTAPTTAGPRCRHRPATSWTAC